MKLHRSTLAVLMAITVTGPAWAEDASPFSANVGVVSNYMWRGTTQTNDGPAIQGGLDYTHSSGFSVGTWASNVYFGTTDPRYELDVYGGYGGSFGDFGYNLTTAYYTYPDVGHANFWELSASGSWNILTVGLSYTLDGQAKKPALFREGDFYYYGSLSFDLPAEFKLSGTLGHYDFKDFGSLADYTNWQLAVSRGIGDFGTVNLTYDQNDGGKDTAWDDDPRLWVGWKKTF